MEAVMGAQGDGEAGGRGDYYRVLGCHPSSTEEQILTEYRVR